MLQARHELTQSAEVKVSINRLPVMPAVPRTSNSITNFPLLLAITNSDYVANSFVSGNSGKGVAKHCVLYAAIRVADATSKDFHKDLKVLPSAKRTVKETKDAYLSRLWHLERNILEGEWRAFGFEDGDFIFFGEVVSHLVVVAGDGDGDDLIVSWEFCYS